MTTTRSNTLIQHIAVMLVTTLGIAGAGCGVDSVDAPLVARIDYTACQFATVAGRDAPEQPGSLSIEYLNTSGQRIQVDHPEPCWHLTMTAFPGGDLGIVASHAPIAPEQVELVCDIRVNGFVATWDLTSGERPTVECSHTLRCSDIALNDNALRACLAGS